MADVVGRAILEVDAELDRQSLQGVGRDAESSLSRVGRRLTSIGTGLTAAITAPIVALGVQAVGAASDLGESLNAVQVTFGDAAGGIIRLGEEAAESIGLSEAAFNGLAVQFSAFAQQIAGPGGNVVRTMDELTTRAADFASVMNLDVAQAAELFQSGLAGETEPLRRFGLDLSAAAVQAHAYAEGIATTGEELSEQEKVQARYSLLMQQTAKTQGDFANTSDSLANTQRRLGALWENLQAELGAALLPAIEEVANVVAELAGRFADMDGQTRKVILIVAGLAAALGPVVLALGLMATALSAISLPVIAVVAGIAALTAGLVFAYRESQAFRTIVQGAVSGVAEFFTGVLLPAARKTFGFFRSDILPVIRETAASVAKSLTPAFRQIGKTWNSQIMPALRSLQKAFQDNQPQIEKVTRFVINLISEFVKFRARIAGSVLPILIRLGGFLAGQLIREIGRAIGRVGAFVNAVEAIVGAARDAWNGTRDFLGRIRTGVSNFASDVSGFVSGMWDGMVTGISAAWGSAKSILNTAISGLNRVIRGANKVPGVSIATIPGLAHGAQNFRGGLAIVGEQGPELVNLPGGSDVHTAAQTRDILGGGHPSTVNITNVFTGPTTSEGRLREMEWTMRYATIARPETVGGVPE